MRSVLLILLTVIPFYSNAGAVEIRKAKWIPPTQIIQSVEDYSLTQNEALFELRFTASGLVLDKDSEILFSCNGVIQTLSPDDNGNILVKVVPGKYTFNLFYNQNHYEITTDSIAIKPSYRTQIKVNFRSSQVNICTKKPVIYLYPEKRTKVSVKLDINGEIEFTYPKYDDGWTFTANPDGALEFESQKHHYLFWDGSAGFSMKDLHMEEGFIVNQHDVVPFLEEKLTAMGFNSNEREDFVTYWGPLMSKVENMYVHFMFTEQYDSIATIEINPKPDHIFRVNMMWSSFIQDQIPPVREQQIPRLTRDGFTVIEWGGAYTPGLVDMITNPNNTL